MASKPSPDGPPFERKLQILDQHIASWEEQAYGLRLDEDSQSSFPENDQLNVAADLANTKGRLAYADHKIACLKAERDKLAS